MRPLLAVLVVVGCSDPNPPAPPSTPDAAGDVPAPPDAPVDVPPLPDAFTVDAPDQNVLCSIMELELAVDPISRPRHVAVTPNETGFVFAWGDAQEEREDVRIADVPSDASMAMQTRITDDDASARDVQILGELAVWLDDLGSSADYQVRGGSVTHRFDEPLTLSARTGNHASPRVAGETGDYMLAFLRETASGWAIVTRSFDGEQLGALHATGWEASEPHLAFAKTDIGFLVAFVRDGDAFVGRLDTRGHAAGAPEVVSTEGNAAGEVALAFAQGKGIVVFAVRVADIRPEVRSRLLDSRGESERPEQVISQAPQLGRSPSAVAFEGGYAVIYRAGVNEGDDHVRLAFVHGSDGTVVAEYDFGDSGFEDGHPGAAVDTDGVLAVGWAHRIRDGISSGTVIRGARLQCAEAWLRCSPEGR